jgi:hypothetical protein
MASNMRATREHLLERRDAAIRELHTLGNLMRGTLRIVGVRCGAPRCECAKGVKHLKKHLSVTLKGHTRTAYVGEQRAPEVQQLLSEYLRARALIEELTKVNLELLRPQHRSPRIAVRASETEEAKP